MSLERVALFGAREIDPGEMELMKAHDIPIVTSASGARDRFGDAADVYVHLDMDVHDGLTVRTNRFAAPDGPTASEVRDMLTGVERVGVLAVTGLDSSIEGPEAALKVAVDHIHAVSDRWMERQEAISNGR